jgi:hypothetical protein
MVFTVGFEFPNLSFSGQSWDNSEVLSSLRGSQSAAHGLPNIFLAFLWLKMMKDLQTLIYNKATNLKTEHPGCSKNDGISINPPDKKLELSFIAIHFQIN